jgi:hypothetical protein
MGPISVRRANGLISRSRPKFQSTRSARLVAAGRVQSMGELGLPKVSVVFIVAGRHLHLGILQARAASHKVQPQRDIWPERDHGGYHNICSFWQRHLRPAGCAHVNSPGIASSLVPEARGIELQMP